MSATLTELLARRDELSKRLYGYDLTNHYAYLKWSPAERIEFDVGREKTRLELADVESRYQQMVRTAARYDPEP